MKLIIDIPEKTYHMINAGLYDYGDMNIIIQNGTALDKIKAEIEELDYLRIEDGSDGYDNYIDQQDVIKIINKY